MSAVPGPHTALGTLEADHRKRTWTLSQKLADLFARWNRVELPGERISLLSLRVAEAAIAAAIEYSRSSGRIAQTVRRSAKRLAKLDDAAMADGLKSLAQSHDVYPDLSLALTEACWSLALDRNAPVVEWIRPAMEFVAEKKSESAGGPKGEVGLDGVVDTLSAVFAELTGETPAASNDDEAPEGTFRDFIRQTDALLPLVVGGRRRIAGAAKRWRYERVVLF